MFLRSVTGFSGTTTTISILNLVWVEGSGTVVVVWWVGALSLYRRVLLSTYGSFVRRSI